MCPILVLYENSIARKFPSIRFSYCTILVPHENGGGIITIESFKYLLKFNKQLLKRKGELFFKMKNQLFFFKEKYLKIWNCKKSPYICVRQ